MLSKIFYLIFIGLSGFKVNKSDENYYIGYMVSKGKKGPIAEVLAPNRVVLKETLIKLGVVVEIALTTLPIF